MTGKKYIPRPLYFNKIEPFIGSDLIKVLTGQRRVGKSYVLLQVMDEIRQRDKDANIMLGWYAPFDQPSSRGCSSI